MIVDSTQEVSPLSWIRLSKWQMETPSVRSTVLLWKEQLHSPRGQRDGHFPTFFGVPRPHKASWEDGACPLKGMDPWIVGGRDVTGGCGESRSPEPWNPDPAILSSAFFKTSNRLSSLPPAYDSPHHWWGHSIFRLEVLLRLPCPGRDLARFPRKPNFRFSKDAWTVVTWGYLDPPLSRVLSLWLSPEIPSKVRGEGLGSSERLTALGVSLLVRKSRPRFQRSGPAAAPVHQGRGPSAQARKGTRASSLAAQPTLTAFSRWLRACSLFLVWW